MLNNKGPVVQEEETKETNLSRREILKVLIAASGAMTAAALLQVQWVKPVIRAGVVPVHAQSSRTLPEIILESLCPVEGTPEYEVIFSYYDLTGSEVDSAIVDAYITGCGEMIFQQRRLKTLPKYRRIGGAANGKIWFNFTTNCPILDTSQFCIQLTVNGRQGGLSYLPFFGTPFFSPCRSG